MRRYVKQIRLRIWCIIVFLAVMIFFMVLSGELGWGDSRYMTSLMRTYSGLAFFGCLVYLIVAWFVTGNCFTTENLWKRAEF